MAAALQNPISGGEFSQWQSRKPITRLKPQEKQAEAVTEMKSSIRGDRRADNEASFEENQRHRVKSAIDKKVALNNIMCTRSSNITDKTNTVQDNETLYFEPFLFPKVHLTLSVREKEEDYLAIKGLKLPLRPKKRLKSVQKRIHNISPGVWLSDICQEQYEVRENKCIK
ncbi:hypothetical protein KI387_010462, partial [Taxus chinensis]